MATFCVKTQTVISYLFTVFLAAKSCLTVCDPWTAACQVPLFMGFFRQEYWNGLPCPPPGDLPPSGIEPRSPTLQVDSLPSEPPGKLWRGYQSKTLWRAYQSKAREVKQLRTDIFLKSGIVSMSAKQQTLRILRSRFSLSHPPSLSLY